MPYPTFRTPPRRAWLALFLGLAFVGCPAPSDDEPPDDMPEVAMAPRWERRAIGEARGLVAVDVDDDGFDEIVVAGRRLAAFGVLADEADPLWTHTLGSDLDGAWDLHPVTVDGPAVLAAHGGFGVRLVDARDGSARWQRSLSQDVLSLRLTLFDAEGTEAFFPAGGRDAYAVATGAPLWTADAMAGHAAFVVSAELDGAAGRDLLVAEETGGFGGIPQEAVFTAEETDRVLAYAGDGTLLWSHEIDGPFWSLAAADLSGDGLHAAVVGLELALVAAGADGRLFTVDVDGVVEHIATGDVDENGRDTVFAAVNHWTGSSTVLAISAEGEVLWTHPVHGGVTVLRLHDLEGTGRPALLVGSGRINDFGHGGRLQALDPDPDASVRVLWTSVFHLPPFDVVPAHRPEGPRLVVAGADTVVRTLDPSTGQIDRARPGGGFVHAVASGWVSGRPVVAWGDDAGWIHLADADDGTLVWSRRLDVGGAGDVTGIAIADLEGDGVGDVVATAVRHFDTRLGAVARFRGDGSPVFSQVVDEELWAVRLADLTGDGIPEIVLAHVAVDGFLDGNCGVRALSAAGERLWRREVGLCLEPYIHIGEIDGRTRIGYADVTLATAPHAALLDPDGAILWRRSLGSRGNWWVYVTEDGLLHGGPTAELSGHVTLHGPGGEQQWTVDLGSVPVPDTDRVLETYSRGGALVPMADGSLAVAITTEAGEVRLLDVASGTAHWTSRPWPPADLEHDRPIPGPIAWIPGSDEVAPFLAVAATEVSWMAGEIVALDLDGGVRSAESTAGLTRAVVPVDYGDGRRGAAFAAGLTALAVEGRPE